MKSTLSVFLVAILILSFLVISAPTARAQSSAVTFAAIGDYGSGDEYEGAVATLISGWNPDMILGLGDSYYIDAGGTGDQKYDLSAGRFYCNFLKDVTTITGTFCPAGQAPFNKFFPALGDHDYADAGTTNGLPATYTDYFNLPGNGYTSSSNNERYYDFIYGPVHFFVLNTYDAPGAEPDGTDSNSVQAQWLKTGLGASTSTWNVVVVPNPPYSSGAIHGSTLSTQWPYAQWGADAVLSGDDHVYERILRDGIVYFVDGLGGAWPYGFRQPPVDGSAYQYNTTNGALRVTASDTSMTFEFYSVDNGGTLKDTYTITAPHNTPTPTLPPNSIGWQSPTKQAATTSAGDNNGYEVNPTYAFADDGFAAKDMDSGTSTSTSCTDTGKDKHRFYNYNLSIPIGAIVQGIQVRLDANADSSAGTPKICASLSWDNGVSWSAWKNTPTLTDAEQTYLLGSPTDLWGHNWIASELANTNFQIRILDSSSDPTRDFSLDWLAVNVTYGGGSPTPLATATFTPLIPTNTATATNTLPPTSTFTPIFTATPTAIPNLSGWLNSSKNSAVTNFGDGNGYEVSATNAYSDDSVFATDIDSGTTTSTSCSDTGKDRHKYYNYNISVPAGVTIQGLQLRLDAKTDSTVGAPKICASVSWDNGTTWSAWKNTANLTTNEASYFLGGTSDTWGHVWTATELSNSNFQVRIADVASDISRDFSLDWIAVSVAYNAGSTSTPTFTNTPLPSTATPTSTPTLDSSLPTATLIPTNTSLPTSTQTNTPTATNTFLPTSTQTDTPLPPTATLAPTNTLAATDTLLPTATQTDIPVPPTATLISTNTPLPPTETFTPTNTPTATWTATATFTATNTALPPTSTSSPTSTATITATFTPLPTNTTGWQNSGKQAVVKTSGDNNGFELSPTNAFTDNGLFAMDVDSGTTTAITCTDMGKDRHKFYNYNLSLPAGATIRGIQIRLDAKADSIVGNPKMCVSLSWDNGSTWTDWKSTSTLTTNEATYVLGSSSDTWGRVWTPMELTGQNSFQIRVADVASDTSRDFSLDWIAVNVTYAP